LNSEGRLLVDGQLIAWQIEDLSEMGRVQRQKLATFAVRSMAIARQRMSGASDKINKRPVVTAEGRYFIFYTFAPSDRPGSSHPAIPIPKAKADKSAGEN
jgi:hypothetical protein